MKDVYIYIYIYIYIISKRKDRLPPRSLLRLFFSMLVEPMRDSISEKELKIRRVSEERCRRKKERKRKKKLIKSFPFARVVRGNRNVEVDRITANAATIAPLTCLTLPTPPLPNCHAPSLNRIIRSYSPSFSPSNTFLLFSRASNAIEREEKRELNVNTR